MPTPSSAISVTTPVRLAIDRAKAILFQPFSLEKWLVIGFAAWLAQLGSGGGGGTGFNFGDRGRGGGFRTGLENVRDWIVNNLYWLIPVAVGIALVLVLIWMVLMWLSSRGQFIFVHDVALDRAEIVEPWNSYAAHGNSLFGFRVALGLSGFVLMLPFIALSIWKANQLIVQGGNFLPFLLWLIPSVTGIIAIGLLAALVQKLTIDFVVPIMRLRTASCLEGWRQLGTLLSAHAFDFVIYLLFSLVLSIAIGILVIALVLLTCCCAGCLMAIPYLGTVLLLPLLVFRRAFSLYYLAQFGPELNVFSTSVIAI